MINPVKPKAKYQLEIDIKDERLEGLFDFVQNLNQGTNLDCLIMFDYAMKNKCKYMLELGVDWGHSTVPLLIAAYLNRGHLWSCDIAEHHNVKEWLDKFGANCLEEYWTFLHCPSQSLNIKIVFDFVFLDSSHDYYQTVAELEKLCKATDVIFCHDFGLYGVNEPVKEFLKRHKDWKLKAIYETKCLLGMLVKK